MSHDLPAPTRRALLIGLTFLAAPAPLQARTQGADPLPSWREGATKRAIMDFVSAVTGSGPRSVAPEQRIAVFDNDGTLWAEQPAYFQAAFLADRARAMAAADRSLRDRPAFTKLLAAEPGSPPQLGESEVMELFAATHAGLTTEEFDRAARQWLASARSERFGRLYRDAIYQPQLELLAFLQANGFKTFIVSGGGIEFLRAFAEEVYRIPPEQVVGSSLKAKLEIRDGKPVLVKLRDIGSVDDGPGKPVNIDLHIGRRPILAFGNSDGDLEMLQWTAAGDGPSLMLLLHHDDGEREVAYDRQSKVGRLDKALDEARQRGWTVVSMKDDWSTVFPPAR